MALYAMGVMCANPAGGTSQYLYGLRRLRVVVVVSRSPRSRRSRSRGERLLNNKKRVYCQIPVKNKVCLHSLFSKMLHYIHTFLY